MLRSENVNCYKISIHRDSAYDIMNQLGKLDILEFENQQESDQIPGNLYNKNILRCTVLLDKVENLIETSIKYGHDI